MIFCSKCFRNAEIVAIINHSSRRGKCPICGMSGVHLYNTEIDNELEGIFDNLLSAYTPAENLPGSFPKEELTTLGNIMRRDWDIFSDLKEDTILSIIKELAPDTVKMTPTLFTELVGVREKYDEEYLREHSILKTKDWDEFVEIIKHKNRFHTNMVNTTLLRDYCINLSKDISVDQKFYRGRISENKNGFRGREIGAPPCNKAAEGRANSRGISRLYLTYDPDTTLHEIRAAEFDYVTIGTFKALTPLKVVDLKKISEISPFMPDVDCTALAINREHLKRIGTEISKTMRRGDSPLDYIPTQYISDFVMSIEDEDGKPIFDGIEYQSAMKSGGANVALFYPEKCSCVYTRTYEVTELVYKKEIS